MRCVQGAIHDIIVDLRPDSPTYMAWEGFDLSAENGRELYVPEGFGHGFITLADDTHVTYQVSHPYTPGFEGGLRYDDPSSASSGRSRSRSSPPKDASWPSFDPARVHANAS